MSQMGPAEYIPDESEIAYAKQRRFYQLLHEAYGMNLPTRPQGIRKAAYHQYIQNQLKNSVLTTIPETGGTVWLAKNKQPENFSLLNGPVEGLGLVMPPPPPLQVMSAGRRPPPGSGLLLGKKFHDRPQERAQRPVRTSRPAQRGGVQQ